MFALCWSIDELKILVDNARQLLVDTKVLLDFVVSSADVTEANLPKRLNNLKEKLAGFVNQITRFKRTPATHIFVLMISSESRRIKPYALPVQCLTYDGMKESNIRQLISNIIFEMKKCHMTVRGKFHITICMYVCMK